jgi:peptidoglycan lytic transglycosylase G
MMSTRRVLWIIGGLAGAAALLSVLMWAGLVYADYLLDEPGPMPEGGVAQTVLLEKGDGLGTIAAKLEAAGVIRNARIFRFEVWRMQVGRTLKAGEYAIPPGASLRAIAALMEEGKVLLHKLTVAEGLTTAQALRLVEADPVLKGPITLNPPEGALLPDTYLFSRGETRNALVARMEKAQRDLLAALWPERAPDLPLRTPAEAVILASVVEKETGVDGERPHIAAVFENRLRRGMRLQSDPTIIYGINRGEPLGRGIRQSEIAAATPYNTYQIDGLPPTPIANPGRAALAAVLRPLDSKDLYFVANGTGGHSFAASAEDHLRNTSRWRAIERARNPSGKP